MQNTGNKTAGLIKNDLGKNNMPTGIMIIGPSGSGKTTLGKIVAQKLRYPYFDVDDYIWKPNADFPYTQMYTKE